MRIHLILSEDLVKQVDDLVGKRKRSRFVEEAVREKLRREALVNALAGTAGILSAEQHPEWETPDKVAAWVKESRQQDMKHLRRLERG